MLFKEFDNLFETLKRSILDDMFENTMIPSIIRLNIEKDENENVLKFKVFPVGTKVYLEEDSGQQLMVFEFKSEDSSDKYIRKEWGKMEEKRVIKLPKDEVIEKFETIKHDTFIEIKLYLKKKEEEKKKKTIIVEC